MEFVPPPVVIGLPIDAWPAIDGRTTQYVDRTHKSDRLKPPSTVVDQRHAPVRHPHGVPIACEPVFSPLATARRLNFPGRCLAEIVAARRTLA